MQNSSLKSLSQKIFLIIAILCIRNCQEPTTIQVPTLPNPQSVSIQTPGPIPPSIPQAPQSQQTSSPLSEIQKIEQAKGIENQPVNSREEVLNKRKIYRNLVMVTISILIVFVEIFVWRSGVKSGNMVPFSVFTRDHDMEITGKGQTNEMFSVSVQKNDDNHQSNGQQNYNQSTSQQKYQQKLKYKNSKNNNMDQLPASKQQSPGIKTIKSMTQNVKYNKNSNFQLSYQHNQKGNQNQQRQEKQVKVKRKRKADKLSDRRAREYKDNEKERDEQAEEQD